MWFGVPQDSRDESVEQLGISLQLLGCKAFLSMSGSIHGRFLQALLGAPKLDETFYALYDPSRNDRVERKKVFG